MTRYPILLAALGAGFVASAATAQAPDPDVKCLMAANVFSNGEKDEGRKQLAKAAGLFFFGRIDARLSPAQLKAQIIAVGKSVKPAELGPIMDGCAHQFAAKEQGLQAIGKSIAAANPQPAAPTPPAK